MAVDRAGGRQAGPAHGRGAVVGRAHSRQRHAGWRRRRSLSLQLAHRIELKEKNFDETGLNATIIHNTVNILNSILPDKCYTGLRPLFVIKGLERQHNVTTKKKAAAGENRVLSSPRSSHAIGRYRIKLIRK